MKEKSKLLLIHFKGTVFHDNVYFNASFIKMFINHIVQIFLIFLNSENSFWKFLSAIDNMGSVDIPHPQVNDFSEDESVSWNSQDKA